MSADLRPGRLRTLARFITEATGHAVCAVAALLVVALTDDPVATGAVWGGVAAIFVAAVPMAFVVHGVRTGRWSDHHVGERPARALPLLVALVSVAAGVALLFAVNAPRRIVGLVMAMLVGLALVLVVTRWWKVSIHCAVAGGFVGVLVVLFGPIALAGLIALAAVAWSRTVLDAHTWPQAVAGSALGGAVALSAFPLLW